MVTHIISLHQPPWLATMMLTFPNDHQINHKSMINHQKLSHIIYYDIYIYMYIYMYIYIYIHTIDHPKNSIQRTIFPPKSPWTPSMQGHIRKSCLQLPSKNDHSRQIFQHHASHRGPQSKMNHKSDYASHLGKIAEKFGFFLRSGAWKCCNCHEIC